MSTLQPDSWLPEYTSDLIDLLHVLTLLTDLQADQAELLNEIASGPLVAVDDLTAVGLLPVSEQARKNAAKPATITEIPSDPDTLFG